MSQLHTPDTFKPLLHKLVQTPEYFTPDDLHVAFDHVFTPDAVLPSQIGAFLTALHINRVERRPESLQHLTSFPGGGSDAYVPEATKVTYGLRETWDVLQDVLGVDEGEVLQMCHLGNELEAQADTI